MIKENLDFQEAKGVGLDLFALRLISTGENEK
jgi:hypothetical protein